MMVSNGNLLLQWGYGPQGIVDPWSPEWSWDRAPLLMFILCVGGCQKKGDVHRFGEKFILMFMKRIQK